MKVSSSSLTSRDAAPKPEKSEQSIAVKPKTPQQEAEKKTGPCENNRCDFAQLELDSLHRADIDEYISDSLKKEAVCFGKTSSQPRTSRLWSTFIGRNLIALPMADIMALKDGDHLAISVFGASHINFIAQDAAALIRRYRDIRNNDYVEAPLPDIKTDFSTAKKTPKDFTAYIGERAGRVQEKYGLTAEAFATALPIFLFTGFLTMRSLLKPKH